MRSKAQTKKSSKHKPTSQPQELKGFQNLFSSTLQVIIDLPQNTLGRAAFIEVLCRTRLTTPRVNLLEYMPK